MWVNGGLRARVRGLAGLGGLEGAVEEALDSEPGTGALLS